VIHWLKIAQVMDYWAIFAILCRIVAFKLYLSFTARTLRPPGSPNQVCRRRRSHRIAAAPGSALPNQAGEESGKSFAGAKKKKGGQLTSLFLFLLQVLVGLNGLRLPLSRPWGGIRTP